MADSEEGPRDSPRLSLNHVTQALLVLAIVATVVGALTLLARRSSSDGGLEIVLPTTVPQASAVLKVYITGAVNSPGVYTVDDGDRLIDVIEAAGGAAEQADLAAMNLAARVRDQDHWHVPVLGEETGRPTTLAGRPSDRIDLNSADAEFTMSNTFSFET